MSAFTISGIVTDSYYSEYELTDPDEPGDYGNATVTRVAQLRRCRSAGLVDYAYTAKSGAVQVFTPL